MGLSLSMHVSTLSGAGGHFEFNSQSHKTIKIGRVQTAQVCLDDARAARVHAVVELSATEANLVDMGSTIGTLVNGAKATRIKLNHGDTIVIGDTHIAIALNAQAQAVPQMLTPGGPIASAPLPAAGMATPASFIAPVATQAPSMPATGPAAATAAPLQDQADLEEAAVRRRSQLRLRAAITEAKPHPGLPAEDPLSRDNRVLELRLYWGDVLMGMNHYTRPKKVTIGENIQADIFLSSEGLPTEQFPLVRYRDGEYLLGFTGAMQGEIETTAQTRTVQQLIERAGQPGGASKDAELDGGFILPLDADARALLHWGGATFALRFVPPARLIPAPFGKNIDWQFANSSIFSVFSVIALIAALAVYPHNTDALKVDLFAAPDRFASLILEAPKETKSTRDMLEKIKKQVEEKKEERQEKQKEVTDKRPDILKQAVKMPVTAAAAQRTAEDKKQEVTKRFSKLLGGGAGSLLGGGGGGNLAGTLQNVIGTAGEASASAGLAGLGIRGTGPLTGGGIGTSRGLAGIGTTGRLGGGGANYGSGVGLGRGKAHNLVDLETPTVEGALSSDVIKRVINENKNQVRYCYEVELQHNQNLEGRVQMRWIIAASGAVAQVSVKDSTIKNTNVENCLMAKIRNWKFPPPAGGGTVEVNYPFVFKAS